MTVSQMLRSMPASEITEWMAYFDIQQNPPAREQTPEEISNKLKSVIGGGNKNGNRKRNR